MEKITLQQFLKLDKSILKNKIIIFPTDTVYGVGCLYNDSNGIEKIYQMKKRDFGKPLPILCSSVDMVKSIATIPDKYNHYTSYWPGALTLILNKNESENTIAVRIPNCSIALELIDHLGPLHTTSVNYSGEKEINDLDEIVQKFESFVDFIITDKTVFSKVPSTIISLVDNKELVIRQGNIKI